MKTNLKSSLLPLILCLFVVQFTSYAQVGINTTDPQGALDVVSTNSGMVLPRVANVNAITNPVAGMMFYDESGNCMRVAETHTGQTLPTWSACLSGSGIPKSAFLGPRDTQTTVDVINISGVNWMDRNLGASRRATSATDALAYGDYYQWGRAKDGHQIANLNTPVITTLATSNTPGHGNIIYNGSADWLATSNDALWQGTDNAPTPANNNPCPIGYRVPTWAELDAAVRGHVGGFDGAAWAAPLALTFAGIKFSNVTIFGLDGNARYWTSNAVTGTMVATVYAFNSGVNTSEPSTNINRFFALSVRCIEN